jgi:hypothetical protein
MSGTRRQTIFMASAVAALSLGLAIPAAGGAANQGGVVRHVHQVVSGATGGVAGVVGSATGAAGVTSTSGSQSGNPPNYTPPAHGGGSHSQGTVAVGDVLPSTTSPVSGDPAGGPSPSGEEVVAGRSRGEQTPSGAYHGHITILALFGHEILGVDSGPGQSAHGPLYALQTQVLDAICSASGDELCLTVLKADSSTSSTGSSNSFEAAGAHVGGPNGVNADLATSEGSISGNGTCQSGRGNSGVAAANVGPLTADALQSSSYSQACSGGQSSQSESSSVLNIDGNGLPIPVAGCANGTSNASFTTLSPLAAAVCNADDASGSQAGAPYGVREALSAFALEMGGTSLAKATAGAAETRAVAPPTAPGGGGTGGGGNPGGGGGNPGGGGTPGGGNTPGTGVSPGGQNTASGPGGQVEAAHQSSQPAAQQGPSGLGTGAGSPAAAGGPSAPSSSAGTLPFTGSDLVTLALIGLGVMAAGLLAMALADRRRRVAA